MTDCLKDRIQCPRLSELYEFWAAGSTGPALLRPMDIEPSRIVEALPHVIILDVMGSPRRYRYRFCGTAVDGINGQYRTGKYLDEIDLGALSEPTVTMMHEVVDRRAPSYIIGEFTGRDGVPFRYERIAMPLSSDGDEIDSILVGIEYLRLSSLARRAADAAKERLAAVG